MLHEQRLCSLTTSSFAATASHDEDTTSHATRFVRRRREDGSIFLAVASYRDENCMRTLEGAYEKSGDPTKLNVGLTQQNCEKDCISGVLAGPKAFEKVDPDEDCYAVFCAGKWGDACDDGRVRVLKVNETESLGPYFARFLGSKLWDGEEYYMQIDSHMTFADNWDVKR